MLKNLGKGKVTAIIIGVITVALVGIVVTSTVIGVDSNLKEKFPSYTKKADTSAKLGTEDNPYTILEIVPDTDSALVGYLIDGQEPNSLLSIGVSDSASNAYKEAFASSGDNSVSKISDKKTAYAFSQDISVIPSELFPEGKPESYTVSLTSDENGYSQYGYFYKVDTNKGDYYYDATKKAFVPAKSGESNDFKWMCLGHFRYVGYGRGNITRVIDDLRIITDPATGETKYEEYQRGFSYNTESKEGSVGDNAIRYEYSLIGDYEWVPAENYRFENAFAENQTEISYVEDGMTKTKTIADAELGDSFYMTRTENVYYKYEGYDISCKDPFIKSVAGGDATGINFVTQVVTVTPELLNIEDSSVGEDAAYLIANADMIFVHNSASGYKISKALEGKTVSDSDIPQFDKAGNSKDLTRETMNRIIYRGAGPNPAAIVFDEEAIIQSNSYTKKNGWGSIVPDDSRNCEFLKRLYDVYNNLGAKLAYNWMSGQQYDAKLEAASTADNSYYRDFQFPEDDALGRSQFVYNYVGNDDSWLTTAFADNNKIAWSALNEPAFNNEDIYKTDSNPTPTMSVAQMMSAIHKESNGYRQPKKLRILEVQPNENYMYDANDTSTEARNAWIKYYLDLIPWFIGSDYDISKDITITAMPTWEFIGRNEDIHENYDMIIFGNKEQDATNGHGNPPGYNNPEDAAQDPLLIDSMAYIGVGDLITTAPNSNAQQGGANSSYPYYAEIFYSGNDITMKKFVELMDYANQAPIICNDDLYYTQDDTGDEAKWEEVNPYKIDRASFMFQLAGKNLDNSFVNKYSNGVVVDKKANSVKNALTVEAVSVDFTPIGNDATGKPVEFESTDTGDYSVSMNSNNQTEAGNNVLRYHFTLNGSDTSLYGIDIYTDINGNGIFEGCINHEKERAANNDTSAFDSEKALTLTIYDETAKYFVTDGILKSGHSYLVTKPMPPTEVGLIPWKLEVYNKSNNSIRYSEVGYTRIAPGANGKKKINVLQMNLKPSMNSEQTPYICFDSSNKINDNGRTNYVGEEFDKYVSKLDDFDINVEWKNNKDWYNTYNPQGRNLESDKKKWADDLLKYDMLIIGFQDSAKFTNDEVFLYGFIKFKESGKPIILSHDLCEDETFAHSRDASKYTQGDTRYFVRDISGQIRKYYNAAGFVKEGDSDYSYDWYWLRDKRFQIRYPNDYFRYNGVYSNQSTPINVIHDYYNGSQAYGWEAKEHKDANMIMDNAIRAMLYWNSCNYERKWGWKWSWKFWEWIWTEYEYKDRIDREIEGYDLEHNRDNLYWTGNTFETNQVAQVNEGKITKYPFNLERGLDNPIEVKNTHMQNYQLDLEYDSDGDVLVWYDLVGKTSNFHAGYPDVYSGRNLDSRNNYYIYTKGNITYTGVGHYNNKEALTPDEIKLFINTMIAAYRSAAVDPYITVTNPDAVNNGDNTTIYVEDKGQFAANETYTIRYRIDDDTTNPEVRRNRQYILHIYKDGQWQEYIGPAERAKEYTIEVPYSEIMTNGEMKYRIDLGYRDNDSGEFTYTSRNITVSSMPLFRLR